MKVWINTRAGDYSGGILLVAADSAQDAHRICLDADEMEDVYWQYNYDTDDLVKMPAYVYRFNGWQEVPNLWYAGVKPCIIAEDGYTE